MLAILALALAASSLAPASNDSGRLQPPADRSITAVWKRDMVAPDLLEWRPEESGGPAIDAATDTVVVGARDGVVRAFFAKDGEPAWFAPVCSAGFGAAPLIDGGTAFAGCMDGTVHAVDVVSGKERWHYDAQEEVGSTPVMVNGLVVFATHQDSVIALDAKTGAWKWNQRRERKGEAFTIRGVARPLPLRGLVYAGWSDGFVSALDPATGAVRWERMVAAPGEQVDVDALATDGSHLFAAAYSGKVVALDPADGKTLWETKAPGASKLAVTDGLVTVVTSGKIMGLAAADGAVRWSRSFDGAPTGTPGLLARRLAIPTGKGLLLLEPSTGKAIRLFDPGSGVSAPPAQFGKRAFVLSNAGSIVALDLQ